MDLIGSVARPALAWIFVQGGIDAVRTPEPRAKMAAEVVAKARSAAPDSVRQHIPSEVALVQRSGGVQIAAGAALATGILPRLSAVILAGSLAPTTVAGHAFWQVDDAAQRGQQRIQFAKNVAIIAGLLLAASRRQAVRHPAEE